MIRHLNRDRYFGGDRAADELGATEAARAGGVRVPEVIAAGRIAAFPGYRAMLATRLIPGVEDLASLFARAPGRRPAALHEAGRQIGKMHSAGVVHPDLNLRNLLAGQGGDVWLIDFDRARRLDGAFPLEQRALALARLARSAAKLGLPLGDDDWVALRDGYVAGAPDFG
jgi:3-deoxy-D-manno-octulosonic acid kinase